MRVTTEQISCQRSSIHSSLPRDYGSADNLEMSDARTRADSMIVTGFRTLFELKHESCRRDNPIRVGVHSAVGRWRYSSRQGLCSVEFASWRNDSCTPIAEPEEESKCASGPQPQLKTDEPRKRTRQRHRSASATANRRVKKQTSAARIRPSPKGAPPAEDAAGRIGDEPAGHTDGSQTSHKAGSRSVAQKEAESRYPDRSMPATRKVGGAFGREPGGRH
jgi:hypothetical protein